MRKFIALFAAIAVASTSALDPSGGKRQVAKPEGDIEADNMDNLVEVRMNPNNPDFAIEFLDPEEKPGLRERGLGKGCRACCKDPDCYCDYYSYSTYSTYCSRSNKRCRRKYGDDDDWWRSSYTTWCSCYTGRSGKYGYGYCSKSRKVRQLDEEFVEAIGADEREIAEALGGDE